VTATKNDQIGLRVSRDLKATLLDIARKEGRSLAQICELLLRGGIAEYEKTGPEYLRGLLIRPKDKAK
jgi:hypothetical protein